MKIYQDIIFGQEEDVDDPSTAQKPTEEPISTETKSPAVIESLSNKQFDIDNKILKIF